MNFKFPVRSEEEAKRWQTVVIKSLNNKCRTARRKKRIGDDQKKVEA